VISGDYELELRREFKEILSHKTREFSPDEKLPLTQLRAHSELVPEFQKTDA